MPKDFQLASGMPASVKARQFGGQGGFMERSAK